MKTWPLLNRNKVQDSKVHVPVEACAALEDEAVKSLSQSVSSSKQDNTGYLRLIASGPLGNPSCVHSNTEAQGRIVVVMLSLQVNLSASIPPPRMTKSSKRPR